MGKQNMSAFQAVVNRARTLYGMFPDYFQTSKHNHYADFGYPTTLTFNDFYNMYRRNGLGHAAINKINSKSWQDYPALHTQEEAHDETTEEIEIRRHFAKIRLWQKFAVADSRGMVGGYSALILRVSDGKNWNLPVDTVSGGIEALVEVIPVWSEQLKVVRVNDNQQDDKYGQPEMYKFSETTESSTRSFEVHPDRVLIVSESGDRFDDSVLMAGYNNLLDCEKIIGAGGEGFWKNAKSAPILNVDKEQNLDQLAEMLDTDVAGISDKMGEIVDGFNKGFDKTMMFQGIETKIPTVDLPQPEEFFRIALYAFAASMEIPLKILIGSQTGERASTEDAKEFNQTIASRRNNVLMPLIAALIDRLESFGVLPDKDWFVDWEDLTQSSIEDKLNRAEKMSKINQNEEDEVFSSLEIRQTAGYTDDIETGDAFEEDEEDD